MIIGCDLLPFCIHLQGFGEITDVEIIFNERGSKVRVHQLVRAHVEC